MVALKLDLVFFLNIFYVSECVRRIKDGDPVSTDKRYVVYLVKAPESGKAYDAWMCGGALVSTLFIVTSAACVDDVEYMYAIAGYKKYVKDENILNDPCTSKMKKKVVYTCIPLNYELQYDKLEKWSFIDIALVKVESAYNFGDTMYETLCSYIPTTIPINFESKFQEAGVDGIVLGWGHTELWRKPDDNTNYNQEMLRYASTRILDKEKCKQRYEIFANMATVIDQYMICTLEKGELDESGRLIGPMNAPTSDGCQNGLRLLDNNGQPCVEDLTRRDVLRSNESIIVRNNKTKHGNIVNKTADIRRSGICQNDHGGPLVTWVGAKEVLIGVASVFIVSDDSKCMGPYLYTSTQCNGAFLDCILTNSDVPVDKRRQTICDSPPVQRGFDTVEKFISWKNHPAGAAENEGLVRQKHLTSRINTSSNKKNEGVSKAKQEFIQLGQFSENEKVGIRPQRPLEK